MSCNPRFQPSFFLLHHSTRLDSPDSRYSAYFPRRTRSLLPALCNWLASHLPLFDAGHAASFAPGKLMGTYRRSPEMRPEDDGSDGSSESIRLQDRPPYDRPSGPPPGRNRLQRPQHAESMQHPAQHSFVHNWRQSSSSDLNMGSPPYTPGTTTPMSLMAPSATWLPENRNSSPGPYSAQFSTPLVC